LKLNFVILANVFQRPEKGVAMPCDAAVPGFPGKGSAFDVSHAPPQHSRGRSFQNCDRHTQPGDINPAYKVTSLNWKLWLGYLALFLHMDPIFQGTFRRRLKQAGVKHSEADVAECENARDEEEVSGSVKQPSDFRRPKFSPSALDYYFHHRIASAADDGWGLEGAK
jgi:hypothetical protein